MNTKKYISVSLIALMAMGAAAQQQNTTQGQKELHKEITLEKDFVPEVKKATKKNTLPKVKKIATPARTAVNFSDWAQPIEVPTSIPTMMPYGYRTAHNFSDKRGYLDVGGGMAANFVGSAGYRIIDTEKTTLGVWLQHNSTWAGKNSTKWFTDDGMRIKQQFNDNKIGADLLNRMGTGTLSINAMGHFDSFNYYASTDQDWSDANKQTFTEVGIKAGWEDQFNINDHALEYNAGLSFSHAGYDKSLYTNLKAAKENLINILLGAEYSINENFGAGLELEGDYVNNKITSGSRNYFLFTASPYLLWENHAVKARVGADILIGKPHLYDFAHKHEDGFDNKKFHVSPNVTLDFMLAEGAAFYIDITGGKSLNTLSSLAEMNRYSMPWDIQYNTFSPFDGEAGFKIGPFYGFSMKVYGGYGIFKGDLNGIVPVAIDNTVTTAYLLPTVATQYVPLKARGVKVGAEVNYRYRSLIEANAGIAYAPAGDNVKLKGWTKGYPLDGMDGASLVSNIDIKVKPLRQLTFDVGLEMRTGRSQVYMPLVIEENDLIEAEWFDMDNVMNLHAGAAWRFDKVVTLWVKGNNLLNRKWDVMPGMGAQKFNVMGGVSLVF